MAEYTKYKEKWQYTEAVASLKRFHNKIKEYYIREYCSDSDLLIDVGSGRGNDALYWVKYSIKRVIGIEPSENSIRLAINFYNKLKIKDYKTKKYITNIIYLNGLGNKNWSDGSAALREQDRKKFIYHFGIKKVQAQNMNFFWTFHYMMDTEEDFKTTIRNINSHLDENGILIILVMDGKRIDQNLKSNNGFYVIKDDNDQFIFSVKANYDFRKPFEKQDTFGRKILVTLAGTYGLQKGIEENIVPVDMLINTFKNLGYNLLVKENHLDISIPERENLNIHQARVSDLYVGLIFKKEL